MKNSFKFIRNISIPSLFLLILFLSINIQQVFAQGYFLDDFSGSSINSVWNSFGDSGVNVSQSNGVLNGNAYTLGNDWLGANLYKSIDSYVKNVSIDYSFDIPEGGMGRVYLEGRDASNNKFIWIIGMTDGYVSANANPLVAIFKQDGGSQSENLTTSWNYINSITGKYSSGSGHIEIQFLSSNLIAVNFTFPMILNGLTDFNETIQVSGPTNSIDIAFSFPPMQYYVANTCLMVDNYVEDGSSINIPMSSYCQSSTNNMQSSTNNMQINGTYNNAQSKFAPDYSLYLILGTGIIAIIALMPLYYTYQQRRKLNQIDPNSTSFQKQNNDSLKVKHLCSNCNFTLDPSDVYCQNCGNRI